MKPFLIRYDTILFHMRDQYGRTSLHLAVLNAANDKVLEGIIRSNTLLINARDKFHATPLHYASTQATVDILIQYGASVDAADNNAYNSEFFLEYLDLIEWNREQMKPASQLKCTLRGLEPIHYAVARNNVEVVRALVAHGADVNSNRNELGMSPVHFAYTVAMLECLATATVSCNVYASDADSDCNRLDIRAQNSCQQTVLHTIVHHPSTTTATMEYLLYHSNCYGCARPQSVVPPLLPQVRGERDITEVEAATEVQRNDVISLVKATDCFKHCPMHYCRTLAAYESLDQMIPRPYGPCAAQASFFHIWAKMCRHGVVCTDLIEKLVSCNYVLNNFVWRHKYSGRHTTVLNHVKSAALTEALILHGAMVNYEGKYGSSPDAAGSIQYFNSSTFTPLHSVRSVDIARTLIDHGAKINIVSRVHDGLHVTPIMCVRSTDTVELLLDAGAIIPRLWYIKDGVGSLIGTSVTNSNSSSDVHGGGGGGGGVGASANNAGNCNSENCMCTHAGCSNCCHQSSNSNSAIRSSNLTGITTAISASAVVYGAGSVPTRILNPTANLLCNGFSFRRLGRYIMYKSEKLFHRYVNSDGDGVGTGHNTVNIPPLGVVGALPNLAASVNSAGNAPAGTTSNNHNNNHGLPSGAALGPSKSRAYANSNPVFMSTESFWTYYTVAENELVQLFLLIQWFEGRAYSTGQQVSVGYSNNGNRHLNRLAKFLNFPVYRSCTTTNSLNISYDSSSNSFNHSRSRSIPDHVLLLHTAKSVRVLEYAINKGYDDVNHREACTGKTPLHYASDLDIIKILLHHGADINAVDQFGCTPLHYQDNVDCFLYLLYRGADIHAKCQDNNKMPFDIICHHYYYGLVNVDERYGGGNNGSCGSSNHYELSQRYRYYGHNVDMCGDGSSGGDHGCSCCIDRNEGGDFVDTDEDAVNHQQLHYLCYQHRCTPTATDVHAFTTNTPSGYSGHSGNDSNGFPNVIVDGGVGCGSTLDSSSSSCCRKRRSSSSNSDSVVNRRNELVRLLVSLHAIMQGRDERTANLNNMCPNLDPYRRQIVGKDRDTCKAVSVSVGMPVGIEQSAEPLSTQPAASSPSLPYNALQSIMSESNWAFLSNFTTVTTNTTATSAHAHVAGGWAGVTAGGGSVPLTTSIRVQRELPDRFEFFHDLLTHMYRQKFMRFVCGHQLDHHWMLFNDECLTAEREVVVDEDVEGGEQVTTPRMSLPPESHQCCECDGGRYLYESTFVNAEKEQEFIYSGTNMNTVAHLVFSNEQMCQKIMNYYV